MEGNPARLRPSNGPCGGKRLERGDGLTYLALILLAR